MSSAVRDLIESFDSLSAAEQREAVVAIAHRVRAADDTADAAEELAGMRLDKAWLKQLAQESPPPASWYEDDARCW